MLLVVFCATGCSGSNQNPDPATPPIDAATSPAAANTEVEVSTTEPEPADTTLIDESYRSVSPRDWERADDITAIVCGIVEREVRHEFPGLWSEGSRESKLAGEYENLIGTNFDLQLERECPAYARLHSKNNG